MKLVRIIGVDPLERRCLRLTLTNGETVDRDIASYLHGPVFEPIRDDDALFRAVRVEAGTVAWPNGADLCPDVLIWGGMPPESEVHGITGEK